MKKNTAIVLAVLLLLAFFLVSCEQPTEKITKPKQELKSEYGDLVKIDFVLSLENGTIVDTNKEDIAKKAGLTTYMKGPYQFILGQSGKVKGFDKAVLGLKVGETAERIIPPSEKELFIKINRTKMYSRFTQVRKYLGFKKEEFKKMFKKEPQINLTVYNETFPWKYKIVNITENYVIGKMNVKQGEIYTLPGFSWPSKVFKIGKNIVTFYQMPKQGQIINTSYGTAKINLTGSRIILRHEPELNKEIKKSIKLSPGFNIDQKFKIIKITDKDFTIKRVGILADKTLKLKVTLLELKKNVKKVNVNESINLRLVPTKQ